MPEHLPENEFYQPFQTIGEEDLPVQPSVPQAIIGPIPEELSSTVTYSPAQMTRPRDFTGRMIGEHVWYAHEAIGGAQAFAIWASHNRTKFYTTHLARMLPQGSSPALADHSEVRFRMAVPVKVLDITDVEDLQASPTPAGGTETEPT